MVGMPVPARHPGFFKNRFRAGDIACAPVPVPRLIAPVCAPVLSEAETNTRMFDAAGVAAALSASKGIPPRDLKVSDIQARLRADGVSFDVGDRDQKTL